MHTPVTFTEHTAMKFRMFSGLFFDLPYEQVNTAGNLIPLFSRHVHEALARGEAPQTIMEDFFARRMGQTDFAALKDQIFAILRLSERQIVLFDAVEEATFSRTRDLEGAGTLHDLGSRIQASATQADLARLLETFRTRIVLTAHPTQFYTEQVLGIIHDLREAIGADDLNQVYRLLLQLGRTRFKNRNRPTPWDEAHGVAWFMEHVLYDVLPQVQQKLYSLAGIGTETLAGRIPVIELGFWPGGDRDGNPNVDTLTTLRVGRLLHATLLDLYRQDLDKLARRLTFDGVTDRLELIRARLDAGRSGQPRSPDAPDARPYQGAAEFLAELLELRRFLMEHQGGLFADLLDSFIHKVHCFGFAFGSMDLRQDSRVLARAVEAVLALVTGDGQNYAALDQEARVKLLDSLDLGRFAGLGPNLASRINDPVIRDCLDVFAAAREIQQRNGPEGLHRFIVSNTNGPADILGLWFLAVCAGFPKDRTALDFTPLFETIDDLEQAGPVMEFLMTHPRYSRHLAQRRRVQHIMLGFSDGTKDGGYLTANWSIYKAKQGLTALARRHNILPVFFDGRGGPPARGGGNTHKFYRSLGRDIESRQIHMTVQGQTISSMYGNHDTACYNLEQLITAGLDNNLFPQTEEWHLNTAESALIEELSGHARNAYLALRNHEDFMGYLEDVSPLRYYGEANISSRPSKRPGSSKLTLGDLRAIPFVGAWSQLKQNIPGYYGLGTALQALVDQGRETELAELYRHSLFFRTLLENSSMSLCKVYLPLTAWVGQQARHRELHGLIHAEAVRTRDMILRLSGTATLLQNDPVIKASIAMREELIIPIALIQQWALKELRRLENGIPGDNPLAAGPDDQELLKKIIIKSMAICVNASRNSV